MAPFARLAQLEHRAARDDFAPVRDERLEQVLEVEEPRLAVDQRHHVHMEGVLQLRHLVEVVQHDFRNLAALQLDDHAHARLVGLIAQVRDALESLVGDQLGELLEQRLLVHLVGQLVDDDRLPIALADLLEVRTRAHHHAAAPAAIALVRAGDTVDDPGGRKVGRGHQLDHFLDGAVRLLEHMQGSVDHFAEVMRRDVGCHADGNARGAIHQQVGHARRQHHRLAFLAVVIGCEVDRLGLDVGEHLGGELLQPALGIAVGRGGVAIDRAEIALAVDQRVAHGEVLCHAHERLVRGGVTVRMVFAEHIADDARALHVGAVPDVIRLVHRKQHTAMHRLQTVSHVRKSASHDHAHRVIEVRAPHLLLE